MANDLDKITLLLMIYMYFKQTKLNHRTKGYKNIVSHSTPQKLGQ